MPDPKDEKRPFYVPKSCIEIIPEWDKRLIENSGYEIKPIQKMPIGVCIFKSRQKRGLD